MAGETFHEKGVAGLYGEVPGQCSTFQHFGSMHPRTSLNTILIANPFIRLLYIPITSRHQITPSYPRLDDCLSKGDSPWLFRMPLCTTLQGLVFLLPKPKAHTSFKCGVKRNGPLWFHLAIAHVIELSSR